MNRIDADATRTYQSPNFRTTCMQHCLIKLLNNIWLLNNLSENAWRFFLFAQI